jgi:AbiJ N-terminal domain 4
MENCPWYKVYDFVEGMYDTLRKSSDPTRAPEWEKLINECFVEQGVGWRMVDGQLESRGPEGFRVAVDTARQGLDEAKLPTAHDEIHEAMKDLSRRPEADLTGAIHHAMGALECTAREYTDVLSSRLFPNRDDRSALTPCARRGSRLYGGVLSPQLSDGGETQNLNLTAIEALASLTGCSPSRRSKNWRTSLPHCLAK